MGGDFTLADLQDLTPVSIHAPAWGATLSTPISNTGLRFQSTPPHGGRPSEWVSTLTWMCFNPRPRMGGDRTKSASEAAGIVSIHAPAWGATPFFETLGIPACHVSIHAPAWGATIVADPPVDGALVSIHAPAWGATGVGEQIKPGMQVSIHAPAWGATRRRVYKYHQDKVSIHAPAWGATMPTTWSCWVCGWFQSTPPHGGRRDWTGADRRIIEFQSTPPHGGRPTRCGAKTPRRWFQSTPPHGGRLLQANTLCSNTKKTGWREPCPTFFVGIAAETIATQISLSPNRLDGARTSPCLPDRLWFALSFSYD